MTPEQEPTFAIGAVSRLTGIPVDTLRIWERRYEIVAPRRSPRNQRCYTEADIARLSLIKRLVDQGHAIGSLVGLPDEALQRRLEMQPAPSQRPLGQGGRVRAMVYGDALPFLVEGWAAEMRSTEIVGRHGGYADFESDVLDKKPQVLVAECAALQPDQVLRLHELARRSAAGRLVVVYGFAESAVLERARKLGVVLLRAPISAPVLDAACGEPIPLLADNPAAVEAEDIPARRFSNEALAAVSRMGSKIRCECPQHLADLVLRLSAFEAYSLDCENRNERDAALHARLFRVTAQARALMEQALDDLVRYEGLPIGNLAPEGVAGVSDWAGSD